MSLEGKKVVVSLLLLVAFLVGCKLFGGGNSNQPGNTNSATPKTTTTPVKPDADGTIPSGTGTEKEKPASGTGNVQGKAFYNQQPAAAVDVKLCEKFNRYFGGCNGTTFTTKTDNQGEYLIKNVPPGIYEGLTVKVFDTNYFVFATSGIVTAAKYKIDADKTFFAPDTNLFKNNLKLLNPKAGSKIGGDNIEVKWDPYPEAAYYKLSIYADSSSGANTQYDYINKRVDGLSYVLDKPLSAGSYSCTIEAFNSNDIKLSESPDDIKFTVTGHEAK